ncbi:hypothetical protein F4804DRAFT_183782 [Jackrogersella minutella]|nr:hypothetical protein F4804DRAFT_183782 [Jackrogersella minutella]
MLSRTARRLTPLRTIASRRSAPAPSTLPLPARQLRHTFARFSSSQPAPPKEPAKPEFWATFRRPIFKVLLLAVFTYQFAYYWWAWLEHREMRLDMLATIADLEARIEQLEKAKTVTTE